MQIEKFGLMLNNRLISFNTYTNGDMDDCNPTTYSLYFDEHMDHLWLVDSLEVAQKAAIDDIPWWASSYDQPQNTYHGKCEVVRIKLEAEIVKQYANT